MAFKMKSGNKVSFKNMGSSPAKQSDEEIGLDTPEAKAIKERDLEKSKNKDLQATIDALKSNKDVGKMQASGLNSLKERMSRSMQVTFN